MFDVTTDLAKAINALPAELQPVVTSLMSRIDTLESVIARLDGSTLTLGETVLTFKLGGEK